MDFNFNSWKQAVSQNIKGWKERFKRTGINSLYYGITATSLLPVVQAYHTGDVAPALIALGGVSAGLGANLLANKIQGWKDKTEAQIAADLQSTPELKETLDQLLEKMEVVAEAQKDLSTDGDRLWFEKTLKEELAKIGSRISFTATLTGDGAIAQGNGAMAAGAGSIMVGGDVNNATIMQGDNARKIDAGTYIEKQVVESPNPEKEKTETTRRAYLERMRKHCQALPLAALGSDDGNGDEVTLDQVYVDLDTILNIKNSMLEDLRNGKSVSFAQTDLTREMQENMDPVREKEKIQPLPLWDAIRATPRTVILGDPGAGKSTFVRKLLGLQAAVMLKQCDPLPGFTDDLLPVLIVLRELVVDLDWDALGRLSAAKQKKELLEHIQLHLEHDLKRTSAEASIALIQNALENGKVLLVLDGLDEVPQGQRKAVRQLVSALLTEYQVGRLVITCRIRSYSGGAVFENLQTFTIRPFDRKKIQGFVTAWYNTQAQMGHVAERDKDSRATDLTRAAISDNLREISSNPMMLTSMAIIHQKEIGLPKERVRLYKLVVDVLLRRWQKYKVGEKQLAPSPELAAFMLDEIRLLNVMERLAYEAHQAGRGDKENADLPRMRALEILEQKEFMQSLRLAEEFLDYVDQRAGLLKGNGGELERPTSYSFPHRTFQEYLAGCYMVRDRNPWREYYGRAAEGDHWSLAAQLGAEELYFNRRAKHTVLDLAYQLMPDELKTEQDSRAALWSAQVANITDVDEIKTDTETPNGGEKYLASLPTRILPLLSGSLTPIERTEAGRILAQIGDPREEVMTITKLTFCRIPAGEFMMGDEKEDDNKPRKVTLPEYFISQYPITNAQFDAFVKAEGYKQEKYWGEAKQNEYWSKKGIKGRWDNEPRTAPENNGNTFTLPNHPVVGLTWYEALAFTRWLNEQIQQSGHFHIFKENAPAPFSKEWQVTLPNEAEWEKAARGGSPLLAGEGQGGEVRKYPWGKDFNLNFANTSETGIKTTSAVGCFPQGVSPYGLQDVSGNVWEWMRNDYDSGKDDLQSKETKGLRGGSFDFQSVDARCAVRGWTSPVDGGWDFGFRVVVSPVLPS
jgi:formylglycine-generating enzyme required for sulfatase activity